MTKTKYESIEPNVAAVDRDGKIVPTEYTKYNSRLTSVASVGRKWIKVASEDTKFACWVFAVNSKGYADAIATSCVKGENYFYITRAWFYLIIYFRSSRVSSNIKVISADIVR